jgi:Aminotransferase class-III
MESSTGTGLRRCTPPGRAPRGERPAGRTPHANACGRIDTAPRRRKPRLDEERRHDVLGVITPGSHGSTFGGNPPAVAVGHAVVGLLETEEFQERARPRRAAPEPARAPGRRQGDHRGSHRRAVGRGRPRSGGPVGPAGRRRPRATRSAGEGDPRHHDSIRTAVDHHQGGARLDAGSVRGPCSTPRRPPTNPNKLRVRGV